VKRRQINNTNRSTVYSVWGNKYVTSQLERRWSFDLIHGKRTAVSDNLENKPVVNEGYCTSDSTVLEVQGMVSSHHLFSVSDGYYVIIVVI